MGASGGQLPSNLAALGFDTKYPIHIASSPGRLDVIGGIADYSGSRVIQMPLESFPLIIFRSDFRRPPIFVSRAPVVTLIPAT